MENLSTTVGAPKKIYIPQGSVQLSDGSYQTSDGQIGHIVTGQHGITHFTTNAGSFTPNGRQGDMTIFSSDESNNFTSSTNIWKKVYYNEQKKIPQETGKKQSKTIYGTDLYKFKTNTTSTINTNNNQTTNSTSGAVDINDQNTWWNGTVK